VRRKRCDKSYLELVHDIAEVEYSFNPQFFPTDEELDLAHKTLGKLGGHAIGWIIAGSRIDKVHPYSPMIVARLIKEIKLPVIMFGSSERDMEFAKEITNQVERQNGSIEGLHLALSHTVPDAWIANDDDLHVRRVEPEQQNRWGLRRTLTTLGQCSLVIGPDTGVMWSVATRGIPKVVLLSHASPTNITKGWNNTTTLHADQVQVPCWPCHRLHSEMKTCKPNKDNNGVACITDIDADTIVRATKAAIAKRDLFGEVLDYPVIERERAG
jgi:ADP-heptose:LPS heptosyltransferase